MSLSRAYAVLHVKAVDPEQRTISGTASTPEPDRMGDVVEPLGITFKNPLPLLLYHNTQKPVGQVTFSPPTAAGLDFEATLPTVKDAGTVRDRIEEAWTSLKTGLLGGVSIGFRSIEEAWNKETGGFRFLKTEILRNSLVAIPGQRLARRFTRSSRSTSPRLGRDPSRVGTPSQSCARQGAPAMEQKRSTNRSRVSRIPAAKHARMTARIMRKSAEWRDARPAETEDRRQAPRRDQGD